jgi:ABC-type transport system involved in cytochrome c biogenesis permease component
MRLWKSWIIASKDFRVFTKKKNILVSIVVLPLMISILLPSVVAYAGHRNGASGMSGTELTVLLPTFTF